MGYRIAYMKWLHTKGYMWYNRVRPPAAFDTRIYQGLPGTGKTLLMVRDCVGLLRSGVKVYSNVAIKDPLTGLKSLPLGGWLDMLRGSVECLEDNAREWRELNEVRLGERHEDDVTEAIPVVFAFDEIHLAADARAWQSTPAWWLNLMAQRRHYGVGLIGTTQDVTMVEKRLRLLVGRVVNVRKHFIQRLFWRIPLFQCSDIDLSRVDEDGYVEPTKFYKTWVNADAYHGYSTHEIMASLDFAELKDDESVEAVKALTERAILAAGVQYAPAFVDELELSPNTVTSVSE